VRRVCEAADLVLEIPSPNPFSRKATLALSYTRDLEVGLTT